MRRGWGACALFLALTGPCGAQTSEASFDPMLRRYADRLLQLFNNYPPPSIYPSGFIAEAASRYRGSSGEWKNVSEDPDAASPHWVFYDELRSQFEQKGLYAPRQDDYRNLVACMALPDNAGQVDEYIRRIQRLNLPYYAKMWRQYYANTEGKKQFCQTHYPSRQGMSGFDTMALAMECTFDWVKQTYRTQYEYHMPAAIQAVTYWYRPLDFCVSNIGTRDFTREIPFRID